MSVELDRDHPIFSGPVHVRFEEKKARGSGSGGESILVVVRVLRGKCVSAQGNSQSILHMEVTSERDAFFLYTLRVSEEDFHDLKRDQSLLVDFASFPSKFVELLKLCGGVDMPIDTPAANVENACPNQGPSTGLKFFAVLTVADGSPVFKVVEANQFKQLTHLSLRFQPGTDETIKQYLSGRLRQTLVESDSRLCKLQETSSELLETKEQLEVLSSKYKKLEDTSKKTEASLKFAHEEEVNKVLSQQKEESLKLLQQTQLASSEQALKQQKHADERIEALETQLNELTEQKKEADALRIRLETANHKLETQVTELEKGLSQRDKEVVELRTRNKDVEERVFELDKRCSKSELTITSLQQQLLDKEELLSKTTTLLESSKERRASAEEKLGVFKHNVTKLQRKLEVSIAEINKGNTIIEKQQMEHRQLKQKIKMKGTVIRQQEKAIEQTKSVLSKSENEVFQLRQRLNAEKATVEQLKGALSLNQQKLEESNKLLESNQNVINYLNQEINQVHINQNLGGRAKPVEESLAIANINGPTGEIESYHARSPKEMANLGMGEFERHLAAHGFEAFPEPEAFEGTAERTTTQS